MKSFWSFYEEKLVGNDPNLSWIVWYGKSQETIAKGHWVSIKISGWEELGLPAFLFSELKND